MHGDVSLEGDGHRHEDGAGEGDALQRVLTVGEQQHLQVRGQAEHLRTEREGNGESG